MAKDRKRQAPPRTQKQPQVQDPTHATGESSTTPRYRELAHAIASSVLTHEECEVALAYYADAELRGEPVRERFHPVWKHLRGCERCRLSYEMIKGALSVAPPPGNERDVPPAEIFPFLISPQPTNFWNQYIRARTGGKPFRFGFVMSSSGSSHAAAQGPARAVFREAFADNKRHLVHSGTFVLGHREIDVDVWAQRNGDKIQVHITLLSPAPLPPGLLVKFRWNDRQVTRAVAENRALFEELPAAELERIEDLSIDFEERDSEFETGSESDSG